MLKKAERRHIEDMVKAALFALSPDLISLEFNITEDHSGDPAIFFSMVVADGIATGDFSRVFRMQNAIDMIVEPEEYGLQSYHNIRSKAEQEKVAC